MRLLFPILALVLLSGGCVDHPAAATEPNGDVDQPQAPPDTGRAVITEDTVDLRAMIEEVRSHMPGRDSNGYRAPTATERERFLAAIEALGQGAVSVADSILTEDRYDARQIVDAVTGRALHVIVERVPVRRGWGTYLVAPDAETAADIHINHPVFDTDTHIVGAKIYRRCDCRWLLMAGTHRYANEGDSADMARQWGSVFQAVHEHISPPGVYSVSVHGFAQGNHDPPTGESDVVLSNGADGQGALLPATPNAVRIRDRLREEGWTVGLVMEDEGYTRLTGSPNPQGRFSNDAFGAGQWIHLELARPLRSDPELRARLGEVFGGWLRDEEGQDAVVEAEL
jgi:hypothetical protein